MSEEVIEPEVKTETPDLGEAGKRAIAAERKRADGLDKELKALRLESETRANAELSELERFKKENAELLSTSAASTLANVRLQVALDKGIPANLAARLQGDDYDTLAADADSLSELLTGTKQTAPKPDPSQGAKGTGGARTNAQQFADQLGDF